jgi:aerobic-type carbon monoxide dehydrogenase small subunit (CoxS/CutS family)
MATENHGSETPPRCDFCQHGAVVQRTERLRFRQRTDRGVIRCHVRLSIGRCNNCGGAHLDAESEARIEAAVLQAYLRLRPR